MHMDMKYATIPMFAKETRWLYREAKFTYVVIDQNSPNNYPLYIDEEDMGCFILSLYMNLLRMKGSNIKSWNPPKSKITNYGNYFLTAPLQCTRDELGEGVLLLSPYRDKITMSYKLEFKPTNNVY